MKKSVAIIAYSLLATAAFAGDQDDRQTLNLSEAQRGHVLKEMRALLSGTQNILAALSKDDMAAVARHARPLGTNMAHKAEDHDHLKDVLPKEFMRLGMSLHQDFDQIASDAESKKDPKLTLRQLSDSMSKCTACHESYQIRKVTKSLDSGHRKH
ncbi:hypothetical protein ABO04_07155 [Nitrosomonas sp. HPC101]|uniref:hypothetical protein n=1 Tax=Nitrosomonas sp. HPC101 TaxID=1658667 RepID=UPI001371E5E0|nr:hypothetical protein [Nitrosomonas sp. HPC101]MXS85688.1 hypothetical protein [Nitrosomonas sp. HPC101]